MPLAKETHYGKVNATPHSTEWTDTHINNKALYDGQTRGGIYYGIMDYMTEFPDRRAVLGYSFGFSIEAAAV